MTTKLGAIVLALALGACEQQASPIAGQARRIQVLEDDRYTRGTIEHFAVSIDDKNWAAVRWCLMDEVAVRKAGAADPPGEARGPAVSADLLVEGWREAAPAEVATFHMFGAPIVNVEGDKAFAIANGVARNSPIFEGDAAEIRGRFRFDMERAGPRTWKISGITFREAA